VAMQPKAWTTRLTLVRKYQQYNASEFINVRICLETLPNWKNGNSLV